ncbi:MAG: DUF6164 family protein [Acidiferrobacterales bacterium]
MARRVYETGHASAEEVDDILRLLHEHQIRHYETPAGFFGLSPGAIWVRSSADYAKARKLIEEYDRARAQRVRAEYARQVAQTGHGPVLATLANVWRFVSERPYEALLYVAVIAVLVAIHVLFFRALS